jgi:hypothetical protein
LYFGGGVVKGGAATASKDGMPETASDPSCPCAVGPGHGGSDVFFPTFPTPRPERLASRWRPGRTFTKPMDMGPLNDRIPTSVIPRLEPAHVLPAPRQI